MKKSSLFISGVLTAFILAVLAGTIRTVQVMASSNSTPNTAQASPAQTVQASVPLLKQVTPQQAALLAAQYMGRGDLISLQGTVYNGANAYQVTFSNGDQVYVSLDGQILAVNLATAAQSSQAPSYTYGSQNRDGDGDGD